MSPVVERSAVPRLHADASRSRKNALPPPPRAATASTRRVALTTVAFACSGATTLAFNLVLVRVLSPSSYGEVARTFALGMAVAQLTMAGLAPAIAREVASGADEGMRLARGRVATRLIAYACAAVSFVYLPLAFAGFGPTGALSLLLGWALAFVYAYYFGLKLLLFVLNSAPRYAALELTSDVIFFALLLLLALVAPTAGVLAFSAAYAVFVIAATRWIRRRGRIDQPLGVDRRVLTYTGWASVATYASIGRFPIAVALTGALAGASAAAGLAALLAILMPFFLVPQAAAVLSFADVARDRTLGDATGASVRRMCGLSAWAAAIVIPVCCLFAHEGIRIALGGKYDGEVTSFLILMLCLAPQLTALAAGQALAAQGAVVANAACAAAGFAVLIVGTVVLAPLHGELGAAIAFGASMVLTGTSLLILGHYRFGIGIREVGGSATAVALGLVAISMDQTPLVSRVAIVLVLLVAGLIAIRLARRAKWGLPAAPLVSPSFSNVGRVSRKGSR